MEAQAQEQNGIDFQGSFVEAAGKSQGEPLTVEEVKPAEVKPIEPVKSEEVKEPLTVEVKIDEKPDYEKLYLEEKAAREIATQRMNSWEGRLSASEKKNQELINALNAQLKEKAGKILDTPVKEEVSDITDEDNKLIETFQKEMGEEFTKPVSLLIRKAIAENTKALETKLRAAEAKLEAYDKDYVTRHYDQILEAHPDVEKYAKSGELNEWAKTLPYEQASQVIDVLAHGNARQVVKLLDDYKAAKGIPNPRLGTVGKPKVEEKPKVVPAKIDEAKVRAAIVVKDKAPSLLPKTEPDKDDFEGTFNAITKDK